MNEFAKFVIKDDIRKRCKVFTLDEKLKKRFMPISLELFSYLKDAQSIDFSIYFRVELEIIEFMKPQELSEKILNSMWKATLIPNVDVEICLLRVDYPKFEHVIDSIREKKIKSVLEKDPTLDRKVLDVYKSLSSASQMIVRGGITSNLAARVTQATAHLMNAQLNDTIMAGTLSRMVYCDATLYDHSASVAMFAIAIAENLPNSKLEKKDIHKIAQCGLYHDAGKSCIPNSVLNKPGKFTPEEFSIMKLHATYGYEELINAIKKGAPIEEIHAQVALEHHERFEGHGYPSKKKGRLEDNPDTGIHLFSRIISIADVYSALLMKRVYKEAMSSMDAINLMKKTAQDDFDPLIFDHFFKKIIESDQKFKEKEEILKNKSRVLMIDKNDSFAQAILTTKNKT